MTWLRFPQQPQIAWSKSNGRMVIVWLRNFGGWVGNICGNGKYMTPQISLPSPSHSHLKLSSKKKTTQVNMGTSSSRKLHHPWMNSCCPLEGWESRLKPPTFKASPCLLQEVQPSFAAGRSNSLSIGPVRRKESLRLWYFKSTSKLNVGRTRHYFFWMSHLNA